MPPQAGRKPLLTPDGVLPLLSSLVHERTGILFEPDRFEVLLEKLQPLAEERDCYSLLDYYYMLKYERHGMEDWVRVMDAISVQESYFFREMSQVRALADLILPDWFQKSSDPFRIWSAACATGEEPFTIAMTLAEAGLDHFPIEIVASDASKSALGKARAGSFRERSFRSTPPALREKYFVADGKSFRISPEISGKVVFHQANLMAPDEINLLCRSQVIFCRNVFIYFSAHAIRQTLAIFASRMSSNGHLFVGAAESLLKLTADFELVEIGDAFAYRRI